MKTGKMMLVGLMTVGTFLTVAYSFNPALTRRKAPLILQTPSGIYVRGSAKVEKGQVVFTDFEGKTSTFDRKGVQLFKVEQLEAEFHKRVRDVERKEGDRTAEYVKLFPEARNQQLFEAAWDLATKLIKRNPANPAPAAVEVRKWAEDNLKVIERGGEGEGDEFKLTEDDVQKIRFALIPVDKPTKNIRVMIKKEARDRFAEEMVKKGEFADEDRRAFLRAPAAEQLRIMKEKTGKEYQEEITISNDPPVIQEFRRTVMPIVARSCTVKDCHGPDSSGFKLKVPMRAPSDIYANFLIMETYGAKEGAVIDHGDPKTSLVVNHMLPADQVPAGLAHPTEIQAAFKSKDDLRYEKVIAWLETLPVNVPDYGIKLPAGMGSTQERPSTRPSVRPVIPSKPKP